MLIRIGSQDNSRIKLVRRLATRKGRNQEHAFVAEGSNLVSEAVRRQMDIDFIMVPEGAGFGLIDECIAADDITVCEVPEGIFNKLTDAENGVGILAVVRMPHTDIQAIDSLQRGG